MRLVEVSRSDGGSVDIILSRAAEEDITLEYFVIQGDVFGSYPPISGEDVYLQGGYSGTVTIQAG